MPMDLRLQAQQNPPQNETGFIVSSIVHDVPKVLSIPFLFCIKVPIK